MRRELNVLALLKADHRYVFVYDDGSGAELIEAFRCWAADPALNFNWFDAAVLTEKARQQIAEQKQGDPSRDRQGADGDHSSRDRQRADGDRSSRDRQRADPRITEW